MPGSSSARALEVLGQVVDVRAAEAREEVVPGGRLDLGEPGHVLEARFFARSMLSASSTGSGSGRKISPTVRTRIFASSQSDQLSRYQRSQLEPLRPRDRVAAVHLRPAGDAGADVQAPPLALVIARRLLDEVGARADEAHLPAEDVDELRQLVQPRAAEPAARARDPRVALDDSEGVLGDPLLAADGDRVRDHRAELEHPEGPALQAGARRDEDDRPAGVQETATARPAYSGLRTTSPTPAATGSSTRLSARCTGRRFTPRASRACAGARSAARARAPGRAAGGRR